MAGLITVRLSRSDSQPWGFRLQGGKDFGTPLLIQKVNGGSLAERAGLQVADAVIKVNGQDVYNLSHKGAQDTIVKAGNSFEVVVSRGPGSTWKPSVTPVGALPSHAPTVGAPSPVTKTSLAYQGPPSPAIGTGHNVSAKPFSQVNGVGSVKSITSKQYNSPVGLYSEQNIAETLSAQTEVLASGVLGVNFMKNEKAYNANNSEVLKMVQEADSEPREPEPAEPTSPISGVVVPPPVSGLRHVSAPETKPPSTTAPLQPGQNICADCERLIVGVFVRIKDKNLHVECFKCATCGTSLKNVGYYNINNKLYCDIHAKLVARANPPAPNLDPITIPPGGHIPSGVTAAPLSNFGPTSPQPGTFAPLPFHAPTAPSLSGPKPFGSPAPAPFSVPVSPPSAPAPPPPFSKSLPEQVQEIEGIACCMDKSKRMSVCSNEVCALSENKSAIKAMESLIEDPTRASPIPFSKGNVVNEAFKAKQLEVLNKSEGIQTSEEGNVQITRKTKVEESFVRSQKMYSAEIRSSSKSSGHVVRAESPEVEQIMERRQMHQSYHDTSRLTPIQHKPLQSDRCLTPEIENLMGKPHGSWSPMPPACFVRPSTPNQIISFPPDIPHLSAHQHPPRTATPEQFQEAKETVERFVDHSKHVQGHTAYTGNTNQSYFQQTGQTQQQYIPSQYIPRSDQSQQPSAFVARGSTDYKFNIHDSQKNATNIRISEKPQNNGNNPPGNQHNNGNGHPSKENPVEENGYHKNNRNPGTNTNGDFENKPTENESEDAEEKQSRKSSRTDQSQKSSRKTSSVSEEESTRRVFSDFGGPQISSAVNVESVTEGGVQKTSVTKSQKMECASCEFESSRKSTVLQSNGNNALNKASDETNTETKSPPSGEPKKNTDSKFSGAEPTNEEEMVTKSQVEEIIKQELNKVFQMAQTMEKTNFGEMYDQKSQQSSSKQYSQQNLESEAIQVTSQLSKETVEQKSTISSYNDKRALTGEVITSTGKLTSGLTIAPESPFTPQALESNYPLPYQNIPSNFPLPRSHPEPPSSKPGYIPITGDRDSPLLQALTIAPDRPYSPLPSATVPETPSFISAPKTQKSSMLEALTTAPKSAVHLKGVSSEISVNRSETLQFEKMSETKYESPQKYAPRPTQSDFKPIIPVEIKPLTSYIGTNQSSETTNLASFPPVSNELKSAFAGTTKAQFSSYSESGSQQKEESKQTVISSSQQKHVSASKTERSITPSGLHPPNLLPYYQQSIGEIPLAHRSNSPIPHQIKAPTTTPPRPPSVSRERRGSVKAMSDAYDQQLAQTKQTKQVQSEQATSSVSYVSSGVYSSGAVTKAYSYEEEHKSIDAMGYHASPLAGKLPLAGEQTLPKCSSPVLGKLDHTKQVFKPAVSTQQTSSAFRTSIAEQANLKQAPPYFVQEKDNTQTPWRVVQEKDDKDTDKSTFNLPQQTLPTQPTLKLSFPSVNKKAPAFPEPPKPSVTQPPVAIPDAGPGGAPKSGTTAGTSAPRRGRGILNSAVGVGVRVPLCASCNSHIRGPFITALGKIWCPDHFTCVNANCRRPLQDIGFVEDAQGLYCEYCFEKYLAPSCNKCNGKVKGDCLNAIGKHFHPECFTCAYCGKLFGNSPFFLEDALPYCEADWNELFTTKCFSCGFPIEAGDRWVEALNNNYHSQCFNCTMCKKNLEGQSFLAKGGRPFCKNHAR